MKNKNTEVLSKGELNAKAELALMGRVVQVIDRENMEYVLDYISKVLNLSLIHISEPTRPY